MLAHSHTRTEWPRKCRFSKSWHTNSHMSWVKWQRGEDMRKRSRVSTRPPFKHGPAQMYKHENKAFAQAFGCERQTNICQCKHWPHCIPLQSVLWAWIRDGILDRLKQINTLLYLIYTIYILFSLRKMHKCSCITHKSQPLYIWHQLVHSNQQAKIAIYCMLLTRGSLAACPYFQYKYR